MGYTSLIGLFEKQALISPQSIAVCWKSTSYTYDKINKKANQFAHHLIHLGVKQGDLVGLSLSVSDHLIVSLLGILKAGAAYLPIDPHYPIERQAYIKEVTELSVLITENTSSDQEDLLIINPFQEQEILHTYPTSNLSLSIHADDLLYVLFTSGSTGKPKGVQVTHENVSRLFPSTPIWLQFNQTDRWSLFHSCSFGFSVWEIWGALVHGACLVICPPATRQQPQLFWDFIVKEKITILSQTPSAFRQLLTHAPVNALPTSLRWVVLSGEMVDLQDVKKWITTYGDQQPQLVNTYALTETAGQVAWQQLTTHNIDNTSGKLFSEFATDMQVYLLDEQQEQVKEGQKGELYIEGKGIAKGYWKQEKLTLEKFVSHPQHQQRVLYRTGDYGRWLASGQLEILGRLDDQVKIRGFRVSLYDISQALKQHPQINDAIVVIHRPKTQALLTAYIVEQANDNTVLTTQLLRTYLEQSLPNYMLPQVFMFIDAIPLNPNNKVDRNKLPAPLLNRNKLAVSYRAPTSTIEQELQAIWEKLLQLSPIGIDDHFFEVGGDSMSMIRLLNQIEKQFSQAITLSDFFNQPTIHALAHLLASTKKESLASFMKAIDQLSTQDKVALLQELNHHSSESEEEQYMQTALEKAAHALEHEQVPIGACIVKDGEIIASAANQVWENMDVTAHAEMRAIQEACKKLGTIHLTGCTLYSTCEPCAMCFSASHWAHISKIVYGLPMKDAGKLGFNAATLTTVELKKLFNSPIDIVPNIGRESALQLFHSYFNRQNETPAEYDQLSNAYQQLEEGGFKKHVEAPFFQQLIGDVKGLTVLDIGCGTGLYTRKILDFGATKVVGVDLSKKMLEQARLATIEQGYEIHYIQNSIATLGVIQQFDLVTAVASLHYAQHVEELQEMMKQISNNLKSGGRLVALIDNMNLSAEEYPLLERWNIKKVAKGPLQDGTELEITIDANVETPLSFSNYFYHQATYERLLLAANFEQIKWHKMPIPTALQHPEIQQEKAPFIGLEAIKR